MIVVIEAKILVTVVAVVFIIGLYVTFYLISAKRKANDNVDRMLEDMICGDNCKCETKTVVGRSGRDATTPPLPPVKRIRKSRTGVRKT